LGDGCAVPTREGQVNALHDRARCEDDDLLGAWQMRVAHHIGRTAERNHELARTYCGGRSAAIRKRVERLYRAREDGDDTLGRIGVLFGEERL
jgi:hypothetical protein